MNDDNNDGSISYDEYSDYFNFVRLAFRIKPDDVYFLCKSEPADLNHRLLSESKFEQVIQGYSKFICSKEILGERISARQPFANTIFNEKRFFIHIKEEPKDERLPKLRPHTLSVYYDYKKECHITFHWKISDRSFFTRLLNSINANKTLTVILFLHKMDDFFQKYAEDSSVKLPEIFIVEGLNFTLR
jgi:hypothetical protein